LQVIHIRLQAAGATIHRFLGGTVLDTGYVLGHRLGGEARHYRE
jgi:hypothetical protein